MNRLQIIPRFIIILSTFVLSGCNLPILSQGETSTPDIPDVITTDAISDEPVDILQAAARDAALRYIQERYPAHAPGSGLYWDIENITEGGLAGSSSFRYSAETWKITINAPVVAPDAVLYQIEVINEDTPFRWEGQVDAKDNVTEISSSGAGIPVTGWLGAVLSTPEGAQFDDYVTLLPKGVGEFGIEGIDDVVEAKIVSLRDKDEPGKYVHFWGTLNCDVLDYGGCQLLVDRITTGIETNDPEPITDWMGRIYNSEPGMQVDDYFVLDGDYPVQYGISSIVADTGLLIYDEVLKDLRDTDQPIKISGQLICGVPDMNGCQIQVSYLEVNGMEVDPYQGWSTYINEFYGYQLRYPSGSTIAERGPDGFPSEELPEGMTSEAYMEQLTEKYSEQLCVSIHFSYGYIYILAPIDSNFRYAICGRTGAGAGELIDQTEEVYIAGETYTAKGFEFIGTSEELPNHNETLVITLRDGTRVEFGALPIEGASYKDYLLETKLVLLKILSTYEVRQ
jgi:hypothetical protein